MGRPKKILPDENQAATERETAPVSAPVEVAWTPPPPMQPRQKRIERQGARGAPVVRRYPEVRGGTCEFCGVIDRNVPAIYQYKLCEHYRGLDLRCSYCPEEKDPNDINYRSILNVYDSPTDPNSLITVCDNYECQRAHQQRFQLAVG